MRCGGFAALAVLAMILAAGCSAPKPPSPTLPPDWQSGAALKPYQMTSTHHGQLTADLYPLDRPSMARPAACVAYRDGISLSTDACVLRDSKYSWEDQGPWVAAATWAGCEVESPDQPCDPPIPPYQQRVVAYDGHGDVLAAWDGTRGPKTMFATE